MSTCGNCAIKENAPEMVRRVMGAIHYCPVHGVYVRPDEAACEHGEDAEGRRLLEITKH